MISIDEQIAYVKSGFVFALSGVRVTESAILASLQRLKAIDEVQVPDEPKYVEAMRSLGKADPAGYGDLVDYIDTLRDLLRRETENREHLASMMFDDTRRAEAAEAINAAMLKLGEEPSEEMACIGMEAYHSEFGTPITRYMGIFKAMFAKLIEQAGVKK